MSDINSRQNVNLASLENPKRGDYWHEMFCAVAAVVAVTDNTVTVLRDREVDENGQVFTKRKTMTRQEFVQWLSYGGETKGTWPDVVSQSMKRPEDYYSAP